MTSSENVPKDPRVLISAVTCCEPQQDLGKNRSLLNTDIQGYLGIRLQETEFGEEFSPHNSRDVTAGDLT